VDTDRHEVTVFRLENRRYGTPLLFRTGDTLTSAVLPQLQLPVRNLFA